ncbi:UNVERIFIED_CONTAM: hypothetical protein Cloal_1169 [Acetivibrio alkalicellulosi]
MPLEYMLLIIIMLIIIPVVAISSNDTAFFIITSLVLVIATIKSFHTNFFGIDKKDNSDNNELLAEIEDQINLDLYKIGKGFQTIKTLIIIVFFIYCTFYFHDLWLKALSAFVIVHWINTLIYNLNEKVEDKPKEKVGPIKRFYLIIVNLSSIVIITFSAYNKFI